MDLVCGTYMSKDDLALTQQQYVAMTYPEYTLSITEKAERRIRRMLRWRVWIRNPIVMLVDKFPKAAHARTKQEIDEYYRSRWSSEYLSPIIASLDEFSVEMRKEHFMNVGNLTLSPNYKMLISGKKDWVLDFVDKKFVLKTREEESSERNA